MSELPKGWVHAPIQNVLRVLESGNIIDQGWSPKCEDFPSFDETTWGALKTTAIQDGRFEQEHTKQLPPALTPRPHLEVCEGDLLMTCAGPRVRCGVICQVEQVRRKLFISGKMYRFKADERIASSQFILAVLRSRDLQQAIDGIKTGGSDSGLNLTQDRFKGLIVPLAPLPEQKRIVAKLDTLNAKSARARTELARIETLVSRYKQAVLSKAFSGELTTEWRREHGLHDGGGQLREELVSRWASLQKKHSELDFSGSEDLGALPASWTWMPVAGLATKVVDGVHKKPHYVSEGVPFITVKNLTAGPGVSFEDCRYVSQEDHQEFTKRTNPENGDILISKDGTLGVVRAVRTRREFSIFVSVALVKPIDRAMTDYLEFAFTSPVLQGQMGGVGTGLQHIHLTDLRKDFVPVAPLEERQEIVRRIESAFAKIDRLAKEAKRALELVGRLDEAIMAKAFRGELVPQDDYDEPAELLLASIRAERDKAPKAKRGRKVVGQ